MVKGENRMKKRRKIYGVLVVALCVAVSGLALCVVQAETEQQQQDRAQVKADVNKQLE